MKTFRFSVEISASKEKVWRTLWEDNTFREWAGIIDEGTYIKGTLKEGNEVQFISSVNGYGVTSLVEKFVPDEQAVFRHHADTQESGDKKRDNEWTGATESYSLIEKDGITTLTLETDLPPEQEETFNTHLPKALERIRILSEKD